MLEQLKKARPYLEKLYIDTATIIEYQDVEDPVTHITDKQEVVVYENVPCKLSHHVPLTTGEGSAASLNLSSYAFFSPDLDIKAGSKIIITRNGKSFAYANSGEAAMGINHQKIMLKVWEDYA